MLIAALALAACGSDTKPGDKDSSTQADGSGGNEDGGVVDSNLLPPDSGPVTGNCGNGTIDNGEHCDGADLNQATCQSVGYTGGTLKCGADCKLDQSGCEGTPSGRVFGQTCSETIGDCTDPLICVTEQGADVGFCTANCDTQACPAVPPGADCIFTLGDDQKVCGFLCDNNPCPPDMYCAQGNGAKYCTTIPQATCGDGKIEGAEDCDGAQLGGKDCKALGYDGGTLKCGASCAFDTAGCTGTPTGVGFGAVCGDGVASCLPGLTCAITTSNPKKGFCTQDCSDTKPCPSSPAGAACAFKLTDDTSICGFLCDPYAGNTCPTGLACHAMGDGYACTNAPPVVCGDNSTDIGEECDGTDLGNMSCKSFGYGGGTLTCDSQCKLDKSGCTGQSSCNPPPLHCTAGNAACSKLELMPASGDGFVRGHPADWSWVRHDAAMIYKYAASQVACLMPGSLPIHTFDLSDKTGHVPKYDYGNQKICFDPISATCETTGQGCCPRHPVNTHEAGLDMDSSYFQTQGMDNPGPVCPHTVNGQEAYHCTGSPLPPTGVLDAARSALMLGKIFESSRVRVVGVDGQIGPLLVAEAKKLASQGLITQAALNGFISNDPAVRKIVYETKNEGWGWYLHHHHHFHASFLHTAYPTPMTPAGAEDALPWADADDSFVELDERLTRAISHPAARQAGLCGVDSKVPTVNFRAPYADKPDRITLKRYLAPIKLHLAR